MSKLVIPIDQVAEVITASVTAVLKAHGYHTTVTKKQVEYRELQLDLRGDEIDSLLREFGRNAAQALLAKMTMNMTDEELEESLK